MANNTGNSSYQWALPDLQDPGLFRVNQTLTSINSRLSTNAAALAALKTTAAPPVATATSSGGSATSIVTTHASRNNFAAGNYGIGSFLTETDRMVVYQVRFIANVKQWVYLCGEFACVQTSIPADLGINDSGFIADVTDYNHRLRWSGTAWGWAPGDNGSLYFSDFAAAPAAAGWHACDGSAGVKYLKSDGTTGTVTLPNTVANASYRKSGATYAAAITAAVAPTVTPTGTVAAPAFSGNAELLATVNVTVSGAQAVIATVGGSAVSVTPSGTNSAPAFTGGADTTSLAGGDPIANYQAITYFRQ